MSGDSRALLAVIAVVGLLHPLPGANRGDSQVGLGRLIGTVADSDGSAIPGAAVDVRCIESEHSHSTVSTDLGRFEFALVPCSYVLTVTKHGYLRQVFGQLQAGTGATPVAITAGGVVPISITLDRPSVIKGVVRRPDGMPLAGATVNATEVALDGDGFSREVAFGRVLTDDTGGYSMTNVPPGTYVVRALVDRGSTISKDTKAIEPEGSALMYFSTYYRSTGDPDGAEAVLVPRETILRGIDITVSAERTFRIRGRVVGLAGLQLQTGDVTAAAIDAAGRRVVVGIAKVAGETFEFPPFPYRQVVIDARHRWQGARFFGSLLVTPDLASSGSATISLTPAAVVHSSLVLTRGKVGREQQISIDYIREDTRHFRAPIRTTCRLGQCDPVELPEGSYRVRVSPPVDLGLVSITSGSTVLTHELVTLSPRGQVHLVITLDGEMANVAGQIVNLSPQGAAGLLVLVFPAQRTWWSSGGYAIRATQPSTDGRFSLGRLPAGEYRVIVLDRPKPNAWHQSKFLDGLLPSAGRLDVGTSGNTMITLSLGERESRPSGQ